MVFVDPGAKQLIDRLTLRVAALEHQVQAVFDRLGDSPPARAADTDLAPIAQSAASDEVLALLRAGKTIEAISAHRQWAGSSLGDAKAAVDKLKAEHNL